MMSDELIAGIALMVSIFVAVLDHKKKKVTPNRKERFIEKAKDKGCSTTAYMCDTKYYYGNAESSNIHVPIFI